MCDMFLQNVYRFDDNSNSFTYQGHFQQIAECCLVRLMPLNKYAKFPSLSLPFITKHPVYRLQWYSIAQLKKEEPKLKAVIT